MYARQTTLQGDASKVDALLSAIRDAVATVRQQRGSKGVRFLVNRQTGKAMVVTLWEDAAAVEGAGTALNQLRSQTAQTYGASTPTTEVFEVLLMEDF